MSARVYSNLQLVTRPTLPWSKLDDAINTVNYVIDSLVLIVCK